MLADVYVTPCLQCIGSKTPAKACVSAGSKPNPLGAMVGEEKEKVSACACCRHNKRRCVDHSRTRSRQIVLNPFHDHTMVAKGGSGKGKVKTEGKAKKEGKVKTEAKGTPAVKTCGACKQAADNDLPDGEHCSQSQFYH